MKAVSACILASAIFISPSAIATVTPQSHIAINSQADNCDLDMDSNLVECKYNSRKAGKYEWIDTSRVDPFTDEEIHELRLHPLKYSYLPDPDLNIGKVFLVVRCDEGDANMFLDTARLSDESMSILYRFDDDEAHSAVMITRYLNHSNMFHPRNRRSYMGDKILSSKKFLFETDMASQGKFYAEYELDHFNESSLKTLSYCFPDHEFSEKLFNVKSF